MTYSQAKIEFAIRHYLWGNSEWEAERKNGYPILRSFPSGEYWIFYQYLIRVSAQEQMLLTNFRLKRCNTEGAEAIGEPITSDEREAFASYRDFGVGWEICVLQEASLKDRVNHAQGAKFVPKAKIRRHILKQFKSNFGDRCFDLALVGLDPELEFKMKLNGWIVNTNFDFDIKGKQFDYGHTIFSEIRLPPAGIPSVMLGFPGSNGWLGLKASSSWEQLFDHDIQPTCDFIINRSKVFFDVLPKMLKGLEYESLTPD